MRILFKIIFAPFVVILTLLWAVLVFLFGIASELMKFACGIGILLSITLFLIGQTTGGIVFMTISFIISPVGLPLIAEWLIDRIDDLNFALKDFIMT